MPVIGIFKSHDIKHTAAMRVWGHTPQRTSMKLDAGKSLPRPFIEGMIICNFLASRSNFNTYYTSMKVPPEENRQTDRPTDRQTDRQTARQVDRHTDR